MPVEDLSPRDGGGALQAVARRSTRPPLQRRAYAAEGLYANGQLDSRHNSKILRAWARREKGPHAGHAAHRLTARRNLRLLRVRVHWRIWRLRLKFRNAHRRGAALSRARRKSTGVVEMRYTRKQYYRSGWPASRGWHPDAKKTDRKTGGAEAVWTRLASICVGLGKGPGRPWPSAATGTRPARCLTASMRRDPVVSVRARAIPPCCAPFRRPPLLFVRGLADLSRPLTLAIVGARSCSLWPGHGEEIAEAIAGAGVTVVSGFAGA